MVEKYTITCERAGLYELENGIPKGSPAFIFFIFMNIAMWELYSLGSHYRISGLSRFLPEKRLVGLSQCSGTDSRELMVVEIHRTTFLRLPTDEHRVETSKGAADQPSNAVTYTDQIFGSCLFPRPKSS